MRIVCSFTMSHVVVFLEHFDPTSDELSLVPKNVLGVFGKT